MKNGKQFQYFGKTETQQVERGTSGTRMDGEQQYEQKMETEQTYD